MTELTVMTFNVKRNLFQFGRYAWSKRCHLVAQVIRTLQPDIMGTQELTQGPLGDLQRLLPEYDYLGVGRGGGGKGEYTAIFYRKDRFNLMAQETFWLSRTPKHPSRDWTTPFPRICTWCELAPKDAPERPIRIYNTHLDHLSYFARIHGLRLIRQEIFARYQMAPGPVVLMGDFNASPTSKTLRKWTMENLELHDPELELLNSYNILLREAPETPLGRSYHGFHGKVTGKPIDYIFTSKDVTLQEVKIQREKVEDTFPSDHYPVVACIEY